MRKLALILVLLAVVGCKSKGSNATETKASPETSAAAARASKPISPMAAMARTSAATAIHVDLYQLSVPYGTVSRNEKFWKRIDEQCVDVTTYDTLFKNGVRLGLAPTAEWDEFRKIMDEHPAVTRTSSLVSVEGKSIELPMRQQVARQNIFYFDSAGVLQGRTYDASENFMALALQPAPRKADTIRLTLCPVVRSTRKKLEYSALNREEPEVNYIQPERLYDLNLRVDVPVDCFFVVAPSGEATWPTSLGNKFFVSDGPAERMETVLLMVPRIMKFEIGATPANGRPIAPRQ